MQFKIKVVLIEGHRKRLQITICNSDNPINAQIMAIRKALTNHATISFSSQEHEAMTFLKFL